MPAMKKGKLCVMVCQVNGTEWVHTLWPVKFCSKAGANLSSLTCKLSQGNRISSDHLNNIVVNTMGIAELRLAMDGLPKSIFFAKQTTRWHNQLQPHPRKISTTYTLNSDILLRPSSMSLLKPSASKSPVKIVFWERPSNVQSAKRLYLVQQFWGKGFSSTQAPQ